MRARLLPLAVAAIVSGAIAVVDAAPVRAAPTIVEAKVLGQVEPTGYARVGVGIRYSETLRPDGTEIDPAAFAVTDGFGLQRSLAGAYVNREAVTREDGTNSPGRWVILEFSEPDFSDPEAASRYEIRQLQPVGAAAAAPEDPVATTGTVRPIVDEFEESVHAAAGFGEPMRYRYFVPRAARGSGTPNTLYPLVLALHGFGERGEANGFDNTSQLTGYQMATSWAHPDRQVRHPAYVVAPQIATMGESEHTEGWGRADRKEALAELLTEFVATHPVDPNRIYITGVSLGSLGAWEMFASHPGVFAAAMTVAGGMPPDVSALSVADRPLWNLISADDTAGMYPGVNSARFALIGGGVPVSTSEWSGSLSRSAARDSAARQAAAAREEGSRHLFTTFTAGSTPVDAHYSWGPAYRNDAVLDWIFSQALNDAPTILSTTAGDGRVTLYWTAPGSPSGYRITVSTDGGEDTVIETASTAKTHTVGGLANGTSYTFRVAAITGEGTTAESPSSSAIPALPPHRAR